MSAASNQRGVFRRGDKEKLRSDFQNTAGGDRVAVKVGVVQVEKMNDQMGYTDTYVYVYDQCLLVWFLFNDAVS